MAAHLTNEQRQLAFRLRHRGLSISVIAKEVVMTGQGIRVVLRGQTRDARPDAWTSATGRLSVHEREEILLGLNQGHSMRAIARALSRAPSTITREVKANGGRRTADGGVIESGRPTSEREPAPNDRSPRSSTTRCCVRR